MRKLALVVVSLVVLLSQAFGQGANDNTIIQSSAKSWPAGPYSQVITNFGILQTSIPLFSIGGKGQTSLDLSLTHRSYSLGNDLSIYPCGRGWSHSGIDFIVSTTSGVTRYSGNRARDVWTFNQGTLVYDREPGVRDDLTTINGGGYKVTDYASKNQYFYDRQILIGAYDLTKVVDPFGNQVTYSYVAGTRNLDRITDASGRYVKFSYDVVGNSTLVSRIRLQCGSFFREWDLSYSDVSGRCYLGGMFFPSPNATSPRPWIDLFYESGARISGLRTFSDGATLGKLWSYEYGTTYPGTAFTGVKKVLQPLKSTPTASDSTNTTRFGYSFAGVGGTTTGELVCAITDPEGQIHKHAYYNDATQSISEFQFPIKRVEDPNTTIYSDPRNNQNSTTWTWQETYKWKPWEGVCYEYTDRRGVVTSFDYWAGVMYNRGLVYTKTTSVGGVAHTDSYEYYNSGIKHGKVSSHTDPQGTLTNYTYDPTTGALTQTALDPVGQNITKNYAYNGSGEVTDEWTGSDPHTVYSNFDVYGNAQTVRPPTTEPTPSNADTNITYDDFNNKISVAEPAPKGTTTYSYDYWNRQIKTTFPDSQYIENTYNYDGNLIEVRNEDGSRRTMTYNFLNLPRTTTVQVDGSSLNNLITTMDYDYNGRQTSIIAPDGLTSTFQYNERGNMIKVSYSDGTNRQFGYDGNGNIVWRQNARDNLTYYFYDDLNRMTSIDYQSSGTPDVSFGYRKDGLRTSRTDQMGTSTWTYNNAKQLTSSYDAATTKTLNFTYQAGTGRPTSTIAPGNTWNFYYDAAVRPEYTTQTVSGEIARFDYWADNSIKKRRAPNNTKAEFSYDTRGRITGIRHAVTSLDQTQEQVGYTYSNGNVATYSLAIQGGATYSTAYTHDYANRLLSEIRTDSAGLNGFTKSYAYTKGNDRASTTKNGVSSTYTYAANTNRFLTGEGYTVNSYDFDGNPTSITMPGGAVWTLSYDEDSRLTQILKTAGNCYFKYNGDGQRVERMTSTSTYRYLLNSDSILLTTTTGPTYAVQAYYSPGIGYFNGGQMHFYQENALGSALVVRDAAGNWESLTEYDAYGGEYAINGTQKSDFRFAGAYGYLKDDDTGMELLGARFYLPVLGRFLNQDPIGLAGGLNLYAYCENNPLSKLDPDGKKGGDLDSVRASVSAAMRKASTNPAEALQELKSLAQLSGITAKTAELIQRRIEQVRLQNGLMHSHHYLPQKFSEFFRSRGVDIEKYTGQINAEIHRLLHGKIVQGFSFPGAQGQLKYDWNMKWAEWISKNPNATEQQMLRFANQLAKQVGIPAIKMK